MTMSEAVSWYRIQEMFRFQSFHMFGIIGSALVVGIIIVQFVKRSKMKAVDGNDMALGSKQFSISRYLIGGIIFGLGWALAGACPGPMFVLVGNGLLPFLVVIASAMLGTFLYGIFRSKLPH